MNLLLLGPEELRPDGSARLSGRRLVHAREVLRLTHGDTLRVGVLGGATGLGQVLQLDERELVILTSLTEAPPARPGIDLLLALPGRRRCGGSFRRRLRWASTGSYW